ncbi:MAG: Uma2 family endonuclease [Desulfobacterales bacterium]|nr:Uma2 family endonuclease [Desulfobacterales bacterium]
MPDIEFPAENQGEKMPSLNHSYICAQILRQLFGNESVQPMTELTLDIGNGLTPDICVYPKKKIRPNFFRDVSRFQEMPILAIEIISPNQNIQEVLEKASKLVNSGVKSVWTVEPYGRTVFITTESGEELRHEQKLETDGIIVDFGEVFK